MNCQLPIADCRLPESTGRGRFASIADGFTLLELLVVIAIIGIVAALSVPALKTFGKTNAETSATRQLLDDVARARQLAIANRSDVYMVFVGPNAPAALANAGALTTAQQRNVLTNAVSDQFTGYALFASHEVGDQPGRPTARYLTGWRTLPEGSFIAASKFGNLKVNGVSPFHGASALPTDPAFPFPTDDSPRSLKLHYIAFNYQGQLIAPQDNGTEIIPLARGVVWPARDANGQLANALAKVEEIPPGNSISISNHIRIDGLTGRARVERQEIQ